MTKKADRVRYTAPSFRPPIGHTNPNAKTAGPVHLDLADRMSLSDVCLSVGSGSIS
jgi:hypothetical protein